MKQDKHPRIIGGCPNDAEMPRMTTGCCNYENRIKMIVIVPDVYDAAALAAALDKHILRMDEVLITKEHPSQSLYRSETHRAKDLAERLNTELELANRVAIKFSETNYPQDNTPWYIRATTSPGGYKNKRNRKFRY